MKSFAGFDFCLPTEVVFGKGVEVRGAELVKKHGGSKVLIVYGGGSVKRSGLFDRVAESLACAGIPFAEFGGVQPNPRRSHVDEGVLAAREAGTDFFLAIGGASAIDTAKALALATANGGEYWKFFCGEPIEKIAPLGTIHTISAAGSEMSQSVVLVDDIETGYKTPLNDDAVRPRFAIMNPELTYTLPPEQTAAGAADIFAHTFMRWFSNYSSYIGDRFCESVWRAVIRYAPIALRKPMDYEARAELMLAGAFSHNDLTSVGRADERRGGEHPLEAQISGHYDTAHGAGLAVIMPAMLRYALKNGTDAQRFRIAQFAVDVFDVRVDFEDVYGTALAGIERFEGWLCGLGLPGTLVELGVPKGEVGAAAQRAVESNGGMIDCWLTLDAEAIREIYRIASGGEVI